MNGRVSVTVERVMSEEKKVSLSIPAILEPSAKVTFRFPIDVKIEQVAARLGESVSQGDLLFELNGMDLSLKLATLKAKRLEKKSTWDKNRYFFEEKERLLQEGKIDRTQYDSLEMEMNKAKAEHEDLTAQIEQLDNQIQNAAIKAPINGIISELNITNGAMFQANETLLTLVQIDPITVRFPLPAEESASITTGMNLDVKIEGFENKAFSANVLAVSPELDAATHNLEIKATLSNPHYTLKGGMTAQVSFQSQNPKNILSIPEQALLKEGEKEYVYVVREGKAWPVRVYTRKNIDNPEIVEIQEGLTEEDIVVTKGYEKLKAGAEVNLWR